MCVIANRSFDKTDLFPESGRGFEDHAAAEIRTELNPRDEKRYMILACPAFTERGSCLCVYFDALWRGCIGETQGQELHGAAADVLERRPQADVVMPIRARSHQTTFTTTSFAPYNGGALSLT